MINVTTIFQFSDMWLLHLRREKIRRSLFENQFRSMTSYLMMSLCYLIDNWRSSVSNSTFIYEPLWIPIWSQIFDNHNQLRLYRVSQHWVSEWTSSAQRFLFTNRKFEKHIQIRRPMWPLENVLQDSPVKETLFEDSSMKELLWSREHRLRTGRPIQDKDAMS